VGRAISEPPQNFDLNRKIARLLGEKRKTIDAAKDIDWATGEALAWGTLLAEGTPVRLSGQDSGRGTFSQRHSVLVDQSTDARYVPLNNVAPGQARFEVIDSPLNEAGVLGFEYGYSSAEPNALVMWEAQFGDFANGAQVIIDQFIIASEDKWKRLSGIVLLLPHGYEGQGPEHSSARLERYLQSCAEHNIQVAQPTTPAQMFHLLRSQVLCSLRKPLVVMTPKSLLRLPAAASALDELASGRYRRVLEDEVADPAKVTRVLLCTGKIYYELADERARRADATTAIVRLETLYPWWPHLVAAATSDRYPRLAEVFWVQDEPSNMGAGQFVTPRIQALFVGRPTKYELISRAESASPATGSHKAHVIEQQEILGKAFARTSP
jgi:2-oxoglutarate dehydrogenase E1 component